MSESGKRIEAPLPPADQPGFVREGEIYWRAMTCTNPECPHATEGGEPWLFITPDPRLKLEDGKIVEHPFATGEELYEFYRENDILWPPVCPACREEFHLDEADELTLSQYQNFVVPYELPASIAERERIDRELHEILEGYRQRTGG